MNSSALTRASFISLILAAILLLNLSACTRKGGRLLGIESQAGSATESDAVESSAGKTAETSDGNLTNEAVRILGRISDESAQPVPGARVKVMRFGDASTSKEATADGNGIFSLDWERAETVAVSARSEGYGTQSAVVDLNEESTSIPLTLPAIHYSQEFEIKADTPELKIELPDKSVSIEIPDPAGALGTTGPIRVEVSSPSASAGDVPMPGGFMALRSWDRKAKNGFQRPLPRAGEGGGEGVPRRSADATDVVQLASVAYSEITLRDSAGNEIHELNTPAKVRMKIEPASLNPATNAPFKVGDTIPMWFIDPAAGTWVPEIKESGEQSVGTIVETDGSLAAEFTAHHFTPYNCDQPLPIHCVKGRIVDPCGNPRPELRACTKGVSYAGEGCDYTSAWRRYGDPKPPLDGSFCVEAMGGSTAELQIGRGGSFVWSTINLDERVHSRTLSVSSSNERCWDPNAACTEMGNVVVVLPVSRKLIGRVVDENGRPLGRVTVSVRNKIAESSDSGRFEVVVEPTASTEITFTHQKGPRFGQANRQVNVPGVTPQPGKCEDLPPVDLGDIKMDTDLGCLRGKVADEDGNIIKGASLSLGGSLIQSDQGGNYCLESLTGAQELNLRFYDRGRGRLHTKKAPYQIVGGGFCGGGDERCVHADIVVDLGDACVSGKVSDQTGKPLDGAVVQVGNQMVTTDKSGHYCIQAAARTNSSVRFRFASGAGNASAESEASISAETSGPGLCSASKKFCTELNQTIQVNQPPEIGSITASLKRIDPSSETTLSVNASDPEGTPLSYRWNSSGGKMISPSFVSPSPASSSNPSTTSNAKAGEGGGEDHAKEKTTWKAPEKPGVYSVSVTVTDSKGATALDSIDIAVGNDDDGDGFVSRSQHTNPPTPPFVKGGQRGDCPPEHAAENCEIGSNLDCDDLDAAIHPGAPEVCDQADNDCNGQVDDVPSTMIFWRDQDGDGFTDGTFSRGCAVGTGWAQTAKKGDCRDDLKSVAPGSVEICDGLDNDCNGQVDENTGGASCSTGTPGVCSEGVQSCKNGVLACAPRLASGAETCDGLDNDCDGQTDESTGGGACTTNRPGVCASGDLICSGGVLACAPRLAPGVELCDGLDNDCDGIVDKGCECINGKTQACYTGPAGTNGVGYCRAGSQTCASGMWGACAGQKLPAPELCDGTDNDCDGQADEQTGGASCSTGSLGVCSEGSQLCTSGSLACAPRLAPTAELCDGLDNDCDGVADESFSSLGQACTAGIGECLNSGSLICSSDGTSTICSADPRSPTPELCDSLDNDCDGFIDEDFSTKGQSCLVGLGLCQASGTFVCKADGSGTACSAVPQSPAPELCDTVDNDCDGIIDNGCACVDGTSRPCYTGPTGTAGAGQCVVGTQTCSGGQWGICAGETTPAVEICDGIDNDCDAQTDENTGGASCSTGQAGVCSVGIQSCQNGTLACAPRLAPSVEVCDGTDNDCDGDVDETFSTKGQICTAGVGQCQASGVYICSSDGTSTSCSTSPLPPTPESCDGLDNDCDGSADEDFSSKGQPCSEGVGMCQASGVFQCASDGSALICSASPLPPAPETCDAFDNDCNGITDEGCNCLDGATQPCYTGPAGTEGIGQCATGVQTCSGGNWGLCNGQKTPGAEFCDGSDNDCDGVADEDTGGASCVTDSPGVCSEGAQTCTNGSLACAPRLAPSAESCDGLDNDCNGSTDETYANLGQTCSLGTGACSATGAFACMTDGSGTKCSASPLPPAPELCDSLDNDCDGSTDEGFPLKGQTCSVGIGECQSIGALICSADGTGTSCSANPQPPTPESCDGLDNDCDGQTDEDGVCIPAAPSNLTAYAVSATEIRLNWTDNSNNEDRFIIERKITSGGTFSQLATTPANTITFTDSGLTTDTEYWYRVAATGAAGISTHSNAASAQSAPPPKVAEITAGWYHTCRRQPDGTAKCWGYNAQGQLGDGTAASKTTPVTVYSLTNSAGVAAGGLHTCSLTADGSVKCWGYNAYGQIGDGTTTSKTTPVAISGVTNALAVASGAYHTCSLAADGSVKCWGFNGSGQIGDGTMTNKTIPVSVSSLSNAVAVTGGTYYTCSLASDGSVKCWGDNAYGQIGDGTTTSKTTPVAISGVTNALAVASGAYHTCSLASDGSVKCWGFNGSGQIGDGTMTNKTIPVSVSSLTNTVAVASGAYHTCSLAADGSVKCWGMNSYGQLGDGTFTSSLIPVQVLGLP